VGNSSLRTKLVVAYTGLSILAVISLALYVDNRLKEVLIERLKGDLTAQAGLVAEAVAADVARGDGAQVAGYLERVDHFADARILVVSSAPGLVAANGGDPIPTWEQASEREGVRQAFAGQASEPAEANLGQPRGAELLYAAVPVVRDGRVVGAVRVAYFQRDVESNFRRVQLAIAAGAVATALATALLGMLFASRISRPLRALSRAAHALAEGDLSQQVMVSSRDEVGQLEESFNTMAARLREHDVARREFASDVSHELHSLASAMETAAEALERGAGQNPGLRERLVAGLVQHTRRLGRLADDLLELARIDGGRMRLEYEAVDLAEIARDSVAVFGAEAERSGIRLVVEAPERLPARADPERLGQALGNLIENALKYSPAGTAITVRTRRDGPGYACDVLDHGAGIPPDVLSRVFERYYRVEGRASGGPGGMGLGLNIAAGIARAHGGTIEARARPEGGSVFTIRLPIAASGPAEPRPQAERPPVEPPVAVG
jgi:two-component system sensor histidine kinase BaeS